MRFKENQQAAEQPHLTNNGSPDMRYKENQQAAAAAGTEHIKQDGTPDMRFKENKEEEEEPEHVKQDGTPDMRFKENQQAAAEPEHVKQDGTRQAGRQPGHALQGEQGGRGAAYHYNHYCRIQQHHWPECRVRTRAPS
eukprot:TRINITY_DN520_c0_g1_i6.p3 TRINITY_DN520_c0_g1~~TRINITY_DN520_c0_g1_i6.p3  ORF type:complete len:138 (-),score=42.81 TRINITY_DN520_c0_g1_i6:109-522(-)